MVRGGGHGVLSVWFIDMSQVPGEIYGSQWRLNKQNNKLTKYLCVCVCVSFQKLLSICSDNLSNSPNGAEVNAQGG